MGLRKAVVWLGLAEQDDEALSYHEDLTEPAGEHPPREAPADDGYQIATIRPQTFRDALIIGECFRQDVPVVVNLHDLETPDAKRIVDFMSGLIFGRRGDIERLSSRVFLIVPRQCSIIRERGLLADKGFFNQT